MTDTDKVKELVEWVAKTIWRNEYERGKPLVPVKWEALPEWAENVYLDLAKQILSHPDLALIDREKREENEYSGYRPIIIPLAPAIKEMEAFTGRKY